MPYDHEAVKQWLRENIKRSPRLQEIADEFRIPPETLRRNFLRNEGKPISYFIDETRLTAVRDELRNKKRCCYEIAYDFKFRYETNAERWFERKAGMTMMEFRNRNGRECGDAGCVDEQQPEVRGQQKAESRKQKGLHLVSSAQNLNIAYFRKLSRPIPQMITASDYR